MITKELTMEEFVYGVYIDGITQYNGFLDWFRKRKIMVDFDNLLFVTGLINAKMVEKALDDENVKIEFNLIDEVIKHLNETVPVDMSEEERKEVAEYIQTKNDEIKDLFTINNNISNIVNYFISEVAYKPIKNKRINNKLNQKFKDWQDFCCDLIRSIKM